jgi:hypothetical protein
LGQQQKAERTLADLSLAQFFRISQPAGDSRSMPYINRIIMTILTQIITNRKVFNNDVSNTDW